MFCRGGYLLRRAVPVPLTPSTNVLDDAFGFPEVYLQK